MLVNKTVEFFLSEAARLGWQRTDAGLAAGSERDAGGAEAGLGADRCWVEADAGGVPRLGWQRNLQGPGRRQPNQLKIKRSIISSSNSGFSKSFSLVMIKLLCSQNPASW